MDFTPLLQEYIALKNALCEAKTPTESAMKIDQEWDVLEFFRKTNVGENASRHFAMSVLQECSQEQPTRVSCKHVIEECPARLAYKSVPHKMFSKSVCHTKECPQKCRARVSHMRVAQECPYRVSCRSVKRRCRASVLQERPRRVSPQNVLEECFEECQAKV